MSPHIRAVHCTDQFVRDLYIRTEAHYPQAVSIQIIMSDMPVGAHRVILIGPSVCLPLAITSYDIHPQGCVMEVQALSARDRLECMAAFTKHSPLPRLYDPLRGSRDLGQLFQLALET